MATKTIAKGKTSAKGSIAGTGTGTGTDSGVGTGAMNYRKVYTTDEMLDLVDFMGFSKPMKGRNDHFFPLTYHTHTPSPFANEFFHFRTYKSGHNPDTISFGYDAGRIEGSSYPITVQLTPAAASDLEKFDERLKNKWLDEIEANGAVEEFKAAAGPLVAPAKGGTYKIKSRELLEGEWNKSPLVKDGNEKALAAGKRDTNYPKSIKVKVLTEDLGGTKKTVLQKCKWIDGHKSKDGTQKVLSKPVPCSITELENPTPTDGGGARMHNGKVLMTLGISRNAVYIGGTGAGFSIIAKQILIIENEEIEEGPGVDLAGVEMLEAALGDEAEDELKLAQQGTLEAMDAHSSDPYGGIDG